MSPSTASGTVLGLTDAARISLSSATPMQVAVQRTVDQTSLTLTATLLKANPQSILLKSIGNIASPIIPIHFPPIVLDRISYVLPLGSSIKTAQGQSFAVLVQFSVSGPATTIGLTYSGLPIGVSRSATESVNYRANSTQRIFLNFVVARDAPLVSTTFVIHYTGYNGVQQGQIPITLVIWSGFTMQHQLEDEWCWAAVSTSVEHFYNPSSAVTQCMVVNNQLNRTDCCSNSGSSACNVPGYLDKALSYVNRLDHEDGSSESYATVVSQTSAWHPLGIRVAWSGGGAHFIAATGYEQNQMVVMDDPWYGPSVVTYNTLMGTYQGSGKWTNSYFTKP